MFRWEQQTIQHLETITLEEALDLFKLPREVGMYENKKVVAAVGKFGPYVSHNSKFYSLKKEDNPLTVTLPRSIELIKEKIEKDKNKIIRQFDDDLSVLNGRWGAYICYKKDNYKIPKKLSPTELSKEECMKIIKEQGTKEKKGGKEPKEKTKKSKK